MRPKNTLLALLIVSIIMLSCSKEIQEATIIKDVEVGSTFTMVPGETVRLFIPYEFQLTLIRFDDYIKTPDYSPSAVAHFEFKVQNGTGGTGLQLNEDQIENGPIFFSGCNQGKIGGGENDLVPVFFITEEVKFEEQPTKFIFKSIRFKIIYDDGSPFNCAS
ncbi:MAG: hypothetical protein WBN18_07485 [Flavobacteriaceae bacterium]